jgi:hypothetical protein
MQQRVHASENMLLEGQADMSRVRFRKNITQAEYDALAVKNPQTLYFISDKKTIRLGSETYGINISGDDGNMITFNEDGLYAAPDEHVYVTGVKGAAEDEYRTGNVDLSPDDVGAENAANRTGALNAQSSDTQYPTAKVVYDELFILKHGKVDKNGTDRLMEATEATKLAGIAAGAQVNPAFALASDVNAGTNTTKVMTPAMTAQAIGLAGGFTVVVRMELPLGMEFSELGPTCVIYDYRGIVTVVCNVRKGWEIQQGDVVAIVPSVACPLRTVMFPAMMTANALGNTCRLALCSLEPSGAILVKSDGVSSTRIAFSITYAISA